MAITQFVDLASRFKEFPAEGRTVSATINLSGVFYGFPPGSLRLLPEETKHRHNEDGTDTITVTFSYEPPDTPAVVQGEGGPNP
jgi:hypothetical protein